MSRLSIETSNRAQTVLRGLIRDMERRINASQPGLCPVDMSLNFLRLCHAVLRQRPYISPISSCV